LPRPIRWLGRNDAKRASPRSESGGASRDSKRACAAALAWMALMTSGRNRKPRLMARREPMADASIVPTYLLSRFTREHVKVALGGDAATRITELSVPKSSELFAASGSATQREPLIMKAYSCWPGESGTDTVHTPGAPDGFS